MTKRSSGDKHELGLREGATEKRRGGAGPACRSGRARTCYRPFTVNRDRRDESAAQGVVEVFGADARDRPPGQRRQSGTMVLRWTATGVRLDVRAALALMTLSLAVSCATQQELPQSSLPAAAVAQSAPPPLPQRRKRCEAVESSQGLLPRSCAGWAANRQRRALQLQ
jgi:hypothetical protein